MVNTRNFIFHFVFFPILLYLQSSKIRKVRTAKFSVGRKERGKEGFSEEEKGKEGFSEEEKGEGEIF